MSNPHGNYGGFGGYTGSHGSYGGGNYGSHGYRGGTTTPRKPYKPPKKSAYAALIVKDRNDEDYEDIQLLDEYRMGKVFEEGDFDLWNVQLAPDEERWKYPYGKDGIPAIEIDINDIPYRLTKSRGVAFCAFNATSDYLVHQLGMKLDNHDRDWYRLNGMCDTHGLPQKNTFTVLHQLVEPYNVGISRIVVPRNARRFEEFHPFIVSLGANPFFLADGHTTNEEALEKMFPGNEAKQDEMRPMLFKMWRFECSDNPPTGTVSMRQFNTQSTGHNGGSNYFGPRANLSGDGWHMSIQFGRLDQITYQKPLVLPEYAEYPGSKTDDIWQIKDRAGKTLRQIDNAVSAANRKRYNTVGSTTSSSTGTSGSGGSTGSQNLFPPIKDEPESQVLAYQSICEVCQKDIGDQYVDDDRSCQWCGTAAEIAFVAKSEIGAGIYIEVPEEDFGWGPDDIIEVVENDDGSSTVSRSL